MRPMTFMLSVMWLIKICHAGEIVAFDLDANILMMETPIILFHKETDETVQISPHIFDKEINRIGNIGDFENYIVDFSPNRSMTFFEEGVNGENYFLAELKQMNISSNTSKWKGPLWDSFAKNCESAHHLANTYIVTSRVHPPRQLYEGLLYLKEQGVLKNIPPLENLWPVGDPLFKERLSTLFNTQIESKERLSAAVRKGILLDSLVSQKKQDGFLVFRFSDDSSSNISKAMEDLRHHSEDGGAEFYFHHTSPFGESQDNLSYKVALNNKENISFAEYLSNINLKKYHCDELLYALAR